MKRHSGSLIAIFFGLSGVLMSASSGPQGYDPDWFPRHEAEAIFEDAFAPLTAQSVRATARQAVAVPGDSTELTIHGVPFRLFDAETSAATREGERGTGRIELELSSGASEALLLLRADIPEYSQIFRGANPMYLHRLSEPTYFAVVVEYGDGTRDELIPYNLELQDFGLFPGTQVLSVPLDAGKRPERLIFEDRMRRSGFALLAATLKRGAPVGDWPRKVTVLPQAPENPPEAESLSLKTGFGASDGLRWDMLAVDGAEVPSDIANGPVFALTVGKRRHDSTEWDVVETMETEDGGQRITLRLRTDGLSLDGTLRVDATEARALGLRLEIANIGDAAPDPAATRLEFPVMDGVRIGAAAETWYWFTANGGIISDREADWTDDTKKGGAEIWKYSDRKPMQADGFFNPSAGYGLLVGTDDPSAMPRRYELTKDDDAGIGYRIAYTPLELKPTTRWESPPTRIEVVSGGWRALFEAYKAQRPAPDKAYGNPRFDRAWLLTAPPIWNVNFRKDRVELADQLYGVDWVHLYGWSFQPNETPSPKSEAVLSKGPPAWENYKQWGVYDDLSKYGGVEGFRRDVRDYLRERFQTGVSYYTDPYLYDPNWDDALERFFRSLPEAERAAITARYNRQFGQSVDTMDQARLLEHWSARDPDGKRKGSHGGAAICLGQPGARAYMLEQIAGVADLVDPEAIYIDESNRIVGSKVCHAPQHDHAPGTIIREFLGFIRELRDQAPDNVSLFTEYTPVDVIAPYQNGALGHVTEIADGKYPSKVRSPYEAQAPHTVDLSRFAFPWLRQFEIFKARDYGVDRGWHVLRYPFFNGNGIYGRGSVPRGRDGAESLDPDMVAYLRKILRVQRTYGHAFRSDAVEPLVPTESPLVFANRFEGGRDTVWALLNADYRTARGTILEVPHVEGAIYLDAWRGDRPIDVEIVDGLARIPLEIGPRAAGCVVRRVQRKGVVEFIETNQFP